ncbi:MAG: zinc metallopeptidase [Acidobacteriaceae bacterium]|nr:zinc metallopeptidase [Acidobacteriaceae bacterium]
MEWTPGGVSNDIEDQRDNSGGGGGFGFGHLGIGGILVVGLLSLLFHHNLFVLFSGADSTSQVRSAPDRRLDEQEQPEVEFVSFVLDDVQKNWDRILPETANVRYRHAKLVLFRNAFPSACGMAQDAVGPFYCPEDEKVYLDLGFFNELRTRFGAPGEFAEAYVIAHEIGHHVQKLLGIEPKVHALQERRPEIGNQLSVRLELQADCFAGIWGNSTAQRKIINASDVESALGAAAAVGDDRLQRMATGRVSPERFTHGSSAQRVSWFKRGLQTGQISACNTFENR